jgi:hypothetical protein
MNLGKLDNHHVGMWMIWGKLDNGWIMKNWTMDGTYENGAWMETKKKMDSKILNSEEVG